MVDADTRGQLLSGRFAGKCAVVSGASSGIGRATVRRLIQEGARVAGLGRSRQRLEEAVAGLSSASFHPVEVDVRDPAALDTAVADCVGWMGRSPEVLVNSAGVYRWAPALDTTLELWNEALETDLRAPFLLSCAVVRGRAHERSSTLSIVHVSSTAAYRGVASEPSVAYNVSKAGLNMLAKQTALEWASLGVRVNVVVPGVIDTPMLSLMDDPEAGRAFLERYVPLRRLGTADECASLICYLASDDAAYVTGAVMSVDGGRLLA